MTKKFEGIDQQKVLTLYNKGTSVVDVAKRMNVSKFHVKTILVHAGILAAPRTELANRIIRLAKQGYLKIQIKEMLEVSPSYISFVLNCHKFPVRASKEHIADHWEKVKKLKIAI